MNNHIQAPVRRTLVLLVAAGLLATACSGGAGTASPTRAPSVAPTVAATGTPTAPSSGTPTASSVAPTASPSSAPSATATDAPSASPTEAPSTSASVSPPASPASATYEACASAATAPITLTEWDQEVREGIGPSIDQLEAEFMAANPGVTITRTSKSFDDLKATLLQALQDPSGPDIAQVNQGRPDMGTAVQGGLLVPLTPYLTKYGWDQRWGQGVHARNSFSEDGKTFGQGNVYGVSVTGEVVGLYYNKEKYTALSLSEPKSWDEFMTQLQSIKDAGCLLYTSPSPRDS